MSVRIASVVFVFMFLVGAVAAQTGPSLSEINRLNGFDIMLDEIGSGFAGGIHSVPGPKPERLIDAWAVAVEGSFDSERMKAAVEEIAAPMLTTVQIGALHDYYSSEAGQRISKMEIDAGRPENREQRKTEGERIHAGLASADPVRLALYERMLDSLNAVDIGEATALNMVYAIVAGMLGAAERPATDEEIAAIVKQNTAQLRAQVESEVNAATAWTYRELTITELEAYVSFLESDAGRRYYDVVFSAFDRTASQEARTFGHRLMVALGQRKT